ncbi:MAG: DNA polymerase III subunit chi [Erythrobacter sp.]
MTKYDFWQLSQDPADKVTALIAKRVLETGGRLLVVAADPALRQAISRHLWQAGPESFLANGEAAAAGAEAQPVLLSDGCEAANGASHIVFADGVFREVTGFARVFLLFDEASAPPARAAWRALDNVADAERALYRQENGKWTKAS